MEKETLILLLTLLPIVAFLFGVYVGYNQAAPKKSKIIKGKDVDIFKWVNSGNPLPSGPLESGGYESK